MDKVFLGQINNGKLQLRDASSYNQRIEELEGKEVEVILKKKVKKRTLQQNSALHLWFTQLAEALNDAGFDMRKVLKAGVDIPWTMEKIKEDLWRPVQEIYLKKESTTELLTTDIDKIYDIVNRHIGEKTGVHVPFPCMEELINKENNLTKCIDKV